MKSSARMRNNKQIHIFLTLMKKMCVRLTSSLCVEKPIWDISMWNELWLEPSVPAGAWGQTGPVSTFYLYISLHRPSLPSSTSVSYIYIYMASTVSLTQHHTLSLAPILSLLNLLKPSTVWHHISSGFISSPLFYFSASFFWLTVLFLHRSIFTQPCSETSPTLQCEDSISQGIDDVIECSFIRHVEEEFVIRVAGDVLDLIDERLGVLLPADVMTQNLKHRRGEKSIQSVDKDRAKIIFRNFLKNIEKTFL